MPQNSSAQHLEILLCLDDRRQPSHLVADGAVLHGVSPLREDHVAGLDLTTDATDRKELLRGVDKVKDGIVPGHEITLGHCSVQLRGEEEEEGIRGGKNRSKKKGIRGGENREEGEEEEEEGEKGEEKKKRKKEKKKRRRKVEKEEKITIS